MSIILNEDTTNGYDLEKVSEIINNYGIKNVRLDYTVLEQQNLSILEIEFIKFILNYDKFKMKIFNRQYCSSTTLTLFYTNYNNENSQFNEKRIIIHHLKQNYKNYDLISLILSKTNNNLENEKIDVYLIHEIENLKLFLNYGFNPLLYNIRSKYSGNTLLRILLYSYDHYKIILEKFPEIYKKCKDETNYSLIEIIIKKGDLNVNHLIKIIKLYIKTEEITDVDVLFYYGIRNYNIQVIKFLVKTFNIDLTKKFEKKNKEVYFPLKLYIDNHFNNKLNINLIKYLLDCGASKENIDINTCNEKTKEVLLTY